MTRIDIERRTDTGRPLLWWVLGLIALIAVGMVLWFIFAGRRPSAPVEPGATSGRLQAVMVVCPAVHGLQK